MCSCLINNFIINFKLKEMSPENFLFPPERETERELTRCSLLSCVNTFYFFLRKIHTLFISNLFDGQMLKNFCHFYFVLEILFFLWIFLYKQSHTSAVTRLKWQNIRLSLSLFLQKWMDILIRARDPIQKVMQSVTFLYF